MKRWINQGHAIRSIFGRSRVIHCMTVSLSNWRCHEYNAIVVHTTMTSQNPAWLLLITNLPGHNPTLRMRTWRALKAAGAGLLRDGAYLLPNGGRSRQVLEEQGSEIKAAGGLVHVLSF